MGGYSHENFYINFLVESLPVILGLGIVWTLRGFLYFLSAPMKDLIHLEKETGILRIKLPGFKEYILLEEDLLRIEYELTGNQFGFNQRAKFGYTACVFIRTKDRKRSYMLFISEEIDLHTGKEERKEQLLRLSKDLNKRLAQLLGITAKYKKPLKEEA